MEMKSLKWFETCNVFFSLYETELKIRKIKL